ncbi:MULTISPECIES: hypothetical protein [unclassified Streptococcus]|uniref:hypothetical protein n=1 Tax=unclassified Streptococcus TaxID=2608887 RepID=UPI0010717A0A|nr:MULTISPECIES: hypothetical protein [unclassified Streptococcus]MBF0776235.1 hypothetical protein [Streptococcus sp. 19428wD3_AN2]TFU83365.1 hypothetical protein E4T83_05530 [Streptococcus sp. AN2]
MKKNYSWQVLLLLFAIYLILIAFVPELSIIFDYFRLTLLLALGFLWLGVERKNTLLFFVGLSFSALYMRDIIPYSYALFNVGPLFFGILVLGIALHSINKKRQQQSFSQFDSTKTTLHSSDSNYLSIEANFTDKYEYSVAPALQAISIKAFCANVQLDSTQPPLKKTSPSLASKILSQTVGFKFPKTSRLSIPSSQASASSIFPQLPKRPLISST